MDTVPALYGLSLSQASPSPNAPFPVFVSPSPVSDAPGAGSRVLHAPATDGHAHAPDVRVQQFLAAFKGKKTFLVFIKTGNKTYMRL